MSEDTNTCCSCNSERNNSLDPIFIPNSVAVIGATDRENSPDYTDYLVSAALADRPDI